MNLKAEVRAAFVAQEIKRLLGKAQPKRAFKTETPPTPAQRLLRKAREARKHAERSECLGPRGGVRCD